MSDNNSRFKKGISGRIIAFAIFVVILFAQILNLIHWKNEKGGFFIDEYYTMECVSEYNESNGLNYMYYSDNWSDSDWMDVDMLQARFIFDPSSSLFNCSFADNIKKLKTRNNYFTLLNLACSVLGNGRSIADCSLLLNLFLFIPLQILTFALGFKMTKEYFGPLLLCFMNGFAGITIGLVDYVRMYTWMGILFVLILLIHRLIWDEDSLLKQLLLEAVLGLILFLAYNVQELTVVFMAAMCLVFTISMLAMRTYKKLAAYIIPIMVGGITGGVKLGIFRMIGSMNEDSDDFLGVFYRALHGMDVIDRKDLMHFWYDVMWHQVFGSRMCMFFFIALFICFIVYTVIKHMKPDKDEVFACVLFFSALLYFIFTVVVELYRTRYNQFTFAVLLIVIAFTAGKLAEAVRNKNMIAGYVCTGVISLAAVYGAFKTYTSTEIENLFIQDRYPLQIIHDEYSDWDNLVYHATDENGDGHLYDCIYNAGKGTDFRYITQDTYKDFDAQGREHFLLWTHRGGEIVCMDVITDQGYEIKKLDSTHISSIYECTKRDHVD